MYYFCCQVGNEYNFLQATEIVLFHQGHLPPWLVSFSVSLALCAQENVWKNLRMTPMLWPCKIYC